MNIVGFDHIVLAVADVARTRDFYERTLGVGAVEQKPRQWALQVGQHRISLQTADSLPDMARNTTPGSANFCLITEAPIEDVARRLKDEGVEILEGPAPRIGAAGLLMSVYFRDPDGNLVEVANVG